jgi:hypothetical protein
MTDLNAVTSAGIDEAAEAREQYTNNIHTEQDYRTLDTFFDRELLEQWLSQRGHRPWPKSCCAFVGRAVEVMLRDTIDSVLSAARFRQDQPRNEHFGDTKLAVQFGEDIRAKLSGAQKGEAELAKANAARDAAADGGGAEPAADEAATKVHKKNLAVLSSIGLIRKRKPGAGGAKERRPKHRAAEKAAR